MIPKEVNIKLTDWHYTCGDGCCDDYGTRLGVDGVEITDYADMNVEDTIEKLLTHLGYKVNIKIETNYED